MSKIHVMRFPMDDNFYEISISLKSNPLCKLLNRYKDALTENLEITITDRKFTFKDNQYQSYIPYFPDCIVEGLINLIEIWRDCEYISDSVAEQLIKELADNALNLSNSVYDMQWQEIHHETVYDEDGNIDEKVTRKESFVNKVCFKYNSEDSRIINYYDAQDLKGDKKTIYELVAKNHYFLPQLGSVLYEKYARTDSYCSVYKGEQYKNAVLKLTKDEFISILDYLVEKDYLRTDVDETQRLSYYPYDMDFHGGYIDVKCKENSCDKLKRGLIFSLTQLYCKSASIPFPLPSNAEPGSVEFFFPTEDDPTVKLLRYVEKEICVVNKMPDGFRVTLCDNQDACFLIAKQCREYIKETHGYYDSFEDCFDNTFEYALRSFYYGADKDVEVHAHIAKTYPHACDSVVDVFDTVKGVLVKK